MSRQLDQQHEEKVTKRNLQVTNALDYGVAGSIESMGGELSNYTIYHDAFECMIVLKVKFGNRHRVAFVFSETVTSCILKCVRDAQHDRLKWKADKYQKDNT